MNQLPSNIIRDIELVREQLARYKAAAHGSIAAAICEGWLKGYLVDGRGVGNLLDLMDGQARELDELRARLPDPSRAQVASALLRAVREALKTPDGRAIDNHSHDVMGELERARERIRELEEAADPTGEGCSLHGDAPHGKEAEELRKGLETLLSPAPDDGERDEKWKRDIRGILDQVSARDSLAHVRANEERDNLAAELRRSVDEYTTRIAELEQQLAEATARAERELANHDRWYRQALQDAAQAAEWKAKADRYEQVTADVLEARPTGAFGRTTLGLLRLLDDEFGPPSHLEPQELPALLRHLRDALAFGRRVSVENGRFADTASLVAFGLGEMARRARKLSMGAGDDWSQAADALVRHAETLASTPPQPHAPDAAPKPETAGEERREGLTLEEAKAAVERGLVVQAAIPANVQIRAMRHGVLCGWFDGAWVPSSWWSLDSELFDVIPDPSPAPAAEQQEGGSDG